MNRALTQSCNLSTNSDSREHEPEEYFVGRCHKCRSVRSKARRRFDSCLFCDDRPAYHRALQTLHIHFWGIVSAFAQLERANSALLAFSKLTIQGICETVEREGLPGIAEDNLLGVEFLVEHMMAAAKDKIANGVHPDIERLLADKALTTFASSADLQNLKQALAV